MSRKTIVLNCKCTSVFQDNTYGKGKRLHNVTQDGKKASCTVCEGSARNSKTAPATTTRPYKTL